MEIILNNGTITASDFAVIDVGAASHIVLIVNILNAPTGTSPTLTFTLADVDPIDQITMVGNSVSSSTLSSVAATIIELDNCKSNIVRISWTLGGTSSPTFTGVNITLVNKNDPTKTTSNTVSSNVSASASNVTLLSANAKRVDVSIFNDSTNNLFVKLGATASTSSFAVKILPGGYYELPFRYLGRIDGIWDGTNGAARILEAS